MFISIFVQPIYNCFIFILGLVPGGDVGIAIVILTILVRAVFYPLFTSSIRTQMAMQAVQPELAELTERYKDDRMELARRQSELFKRHRIHPFTSLGVAIIQIVIFISLSYSFFNLGLPEIRIDLLYPFVHAPALVNEQFLGILDLTKPHNIFLTIIVLVLQYLVSRLTLARTIVPSITPAAKERIAMQQMQQKMMLYMLPLFIAVATYFTASAIGLYFAVGNIVSLAQEWLIRRKPL